MMPLFAAGCGDIQVSFEYFMSCEWQSMTVNDVLVQAQRLCFQVSGDHPAAISKYWFS